MKHSLEREEELRKLVVSMRREGNSYHNIMKATGFRSQKVCDILRASGLINNFKVRSKDTLTPDNRKKILILADQGKSCKWIAKELKIPYNRVYKTIKIAKPEIVEKAKAELGVKESNRDIIKKDVFQERITVHNTIISAIEHLGGIASFINHRGDVKLYYMNGTQVNIANVIRDAIESGFVPPMKRQQSYG